MNITDTAFLIPIYPPHYKYMYNLISNIQSNHIYIDIYLIFSSNIDYFNFEMKDSIKHFIIPENFQTNSIITFKKFFGLKQLMYSKYEYIICCDSEIDIILDNFTSDNITKKLDDIFINKKIYAGTIDTEATIISANLFKREEYDKIIEVTNNFNYFFWWSDIPVYKKSHLEYFFTKINYDNIEYNHFDYIIYQYFLILTEGFQIVNTTPITNLNWSLERLNTTDINVFNKLQETGYGFGWITKEQFCKCIEYFTSSGSFLTYHLDRFR
jgi:hypothetical protein